MISRNVVETLGADPVGKSVVSTVSGDRVETLRYRLGIYITVGLGHSGTFSSGMDLPFRNLFLRNGSAIQEPFPQEWISHSGTFSSGMDRPFRNLFLRNGSPIQEPFPQEWISMCSFCRSTHSRNHIDLNGVNIVLCL